MEKEKRILLLHSSALRPLRRERERERERERRECDCAVCICILSLTRLHKRVFYEERKRFAHLYPTFDFWGIISLPNKERENKISIKPR